MILLHSKPEEKKEGWQAQLDLDFSSVNGKTVLSDFQRYGPLTVQRPFYPENGVCHLYLLHPPGGVVGGDKLYLNVQCAEKSEVLLTTPGATKFYRSEGNLAVQHNSLNVMDEASLEWFPQENIYFPGAEARVNTEVCLAANARFIGWETHCFGLPANNAPFSTGNLSAGFSLLKEKRPVLLEKLKVDKAALTAPTRLRGYPVLSILTATPADMQIQDGVRDILEEYPKEIIASTLIEDCLIIRYLGFSTARSRELFSRIWAFLRPEIIQRKACPPRIWAT